MTGSMDGHRFNIDKSGFAVFCKKIIATKIRANTLQSVSSVFPALSTNCEK